MTYSNVITTLVLVLTFGIWAGEINGTKGKLDDINVNLTTRLDKIGGTIDLLNTKQVTFEKEVLIWLDDAEGQRETNHAESMINIMYLHKYNKDNNPQYTIPERPLHNGMIKY